MFLLDRNNQDGVVVCCAKSIDRALESNRVMFFSLHMLNYFDSKPLERRRKLRCQVAIENYRYHDDNNRIITSTRFIFS